MLNMTFVRNVTCVLAAVACASSDSAPNDVTINEEVAAAGHTVIHIKGTPQLLTPTRGPLVGDKEGANLLHDIGSLLLDKDYDLYVASSGTKRLMVYDSTGKYLRDIGRSGEGPAEYSEPGSITWLADTMVVNDPDNGRIGRFTQAGAWIGSSPVVRANVPLYGLGDRAYGRVDFDRSGGALKRVYLVLRPGGVIDTLPFVDRSSIKIDPSAAGIAIDCPTGSSIMLFSSTWRATALLNPAPDGTMLVATTDKFRLVFLNRKGDTVRIIDRVLQPPPVSDEEWRIETERYDAFKKKLPPLTTCTQNSYPRIASKPMLNSVFFDSDANLWVDVSSSEGRFYEVFDGNGKLLQRVAAVLHHERILPFVRGNLMAVVETDSLDIQQVRLYRLTSGN